MKTLLALLTLILAAPSEAVAGKRSYHLVNPPPWHNWVEHGQPIPPWGFEIRDATWEVSHPDGSVWPTGHYFVKLTIRPNDANPPVLYKRWHLVVLPERKIDITRDHATGAITLNWEPHPEFEYALFVWGLDPTERWLGWQYRGHMPADTRSLTLAYEHPKDGSQLLCWIYPTHHTDEWRGSSLWPAWHFAQQSWTRVR